MGTIKKVAAMSDRVKQLQRLVRRGDLQYGDRHRRRQPAGWRIAELRGRFVEITSSANSAALTAAAGLIRDAQHEGDPVAWISTGESFFYPPDAAAFGIDLRALAVVRVPKATDIGRAADRVIRSGAFGLVVLDLGKQGTLPMPLQGRLVGLAQKHQAVALCLTSKSSDAQSIGSMISLRVECRRERVAPSRYRLKYKVLKDKQRGPTWSHTEVVDGPTGLC